MEHGADIFAGRRDEDREAVAGERDELYRKVDQLPNFGK